MDMKEEYDSHCGNSLHERLSDFFNYSSSLRHISALIFFAIQICILRTLKILVFDTSVSTEALLRGRLLRKEKENINA